MMKLEFEQVLEYVAGGESDPGVRKLLDIDPDGPAMLREARLMYEALGKEPEPPDADMSMDAPKAGSLRGGTLKNLRQALSTTFSAEASGPADLFGDADADADDFRGSDAKALSMLAKRAAGPKRDLGALTIVREPRQVLLSHEPLASPRAPRPRSREERPGRVTFQQSSRPPERFEGVRIRGSGLSISFPGQAPADGKLRIEVTDTRLDTPARGLELIFMPETGPFSKLTTNSEGVAQFDIPEQPGVLRIDSSPPQVLRIDLKK